MGLSFVIFAWLLLPFGNGAPPLSELIDPAAYWRQQDVEWQAAEFAKILQTTPFDPELINRWVKQLGAEAQADRDAAEVALRKLGAAAKPALLPAVDARDPEVALRARAILADLPEPKPEQAMERRLMALLALGRVEGGAEHLRTLKPENLNDRERLLLRRLLKPVDAQKQVPAETPLQLFTPETALILSVRPAKPAPAWMTELFSSQTMQAFLIRSYQEVGEVHLKSLTAGLNDAVLKGGIQNGTLGGLVHLDCDPELLRGWLKKRDFEESEADGQQVLSWNGLRLAFPADGQIVFAFSENPDALGDLIRRSRSGGDKTELSPAMQKLVAAAPKDSPMWVTYSAPAIAENQIMKVPAPIWNLKSFSLFTRTLERGIGFDILVEGKNSEAALEVKGQLEMLVSQMRAQAAEEEEEGAVVLRQLLDKLVIGGESPALKISGEVPISLFELLLRQMEEMFGAFVDMHGPEDGFHEMEFFD